MDNRSVSVEFDCEGLTFSKDAHVILALSQADTWCLVEFLKAAAVLNVYGRDRINALHLQMTLERSD